MPMRTAAMGWMVVAPAPAEDCIWMLDCAMASSCWMVLARPTMMAEKAHEAPMTPKERRSCIQSER